MASGTTRGTEALSTNVLRSVELADDMRWQLSRLVPPRGTDTADEPTERQALEWLGRDVRAYERLARAARGSPAADGATVLPWNERRLRR